MDTYTFTTGRDDIGERLDLYLCKMFPDLTRSYLQKLIKEQRVFLDHTAAKSNCRLKDSQTVTVNIPPAKATCILPENIPLDILYEDADFLIVNKPKGMVVHPSAGHETGTLVHAVMYHCKGSLSGINGEIRPGIVHRIDKDTTGSLVICKNDESHVCIAEQIKAHTIKRIYRGIVSGNLKEESGRIEGNIGRNPTDRKKMAIVAKGGKPAVTHYRLLRQLNHAAYVEFRLETGRTHQIRVHMASIGHPLLGDSVYGSQKNPFHLDGQALHAMTIGLIHPRTGEYVEVSAPIPGYFSDLIRKLE